jgi:hypothetical protein
MNDYDPLDLGICEDVDDQAKKRGRPKSSILDRARASYWAWGVRQTAGKSFAEIERELVTREFPRRDGGGFEQPNAWLKYAKGERCPIPPSNNEMSPVVLAEKIYPGTSANYDSIVWDLLYDSQSKPPEPLKLTSRITPYVLNRIDPKHIEEKDELRILLSPEGVSNLVLVRHLDAFGLLLMQWRNLDWKRLDISLIFLARRWLLYSFQWMEPFVTCRHIMAHLIHHNVRELGLLNGPGGLAPQKSLDVQLHDAIFAALLGGVEIPITDFPMFGINGT